MLKNYIKIAFRNLAKQKGSSFINIAGLAVALAVFLIIMLYIRHETSYNNSFSESERIYRVLLLQRNSTGESIRTTLPESLINDLTEQYPEVENATEVEKWWSTSGELLLSTDENGFYSSQVLTGGEDFFELFDFEFLAGNSQRALSDPNSAVITASTAMKLFGHTDVLNETVTVNSDSDVTITGIITDLPTNSTIQFDLIGPRQESDILFWNYSMAAGYIKLADTANKESFTEKLPGFVEANTHIQPGSVSPDYEIQLQPVADVHLYPTGEKADNSRIVYIRILFSVAVLILIVACINFVNITTATVASRSKEIGIRKTIGAKRRQIVAQSSIESVFTIVLAFLGAVFLLEFFTPFSYQLFGIHLASLFSSVDTWMATLIMTLLVVCFLSCSYVAIYLSSLKPVDVLKGSRSNSDYHSGRIRKYLVVSQFVISVGISIVALLISQQMDYVRSERLGGVDEQVVLLKSNSAEVGSQFNAFKQDLVFHPDIISVSSGALPNSLGARASISDSLGNVTTVYTVGADFDYLETLGIDLVSGRDFDSETDTEYSSVELINETAADVFGINNELEVEDSNSLYFRFSRNRLLGIVEDFHVRTLFDPIVPIIIRLRDPDTDKTGRIFVRLREGGVAGGLNHIRETWARFDPAVPLNYSFLDEVFDQDYKAELQMAKIFRAFSGFAIFIACLGLFGLASYTAQRRTKEIGIRKVMGATVANIMVLLNKDFLKLVAIGFIIAIPIAWYAMNRWLEDFAYRIEIGPGVFLLAGTIAILIALATVSWQSVRAALANPVNSLRSE